MEKLDCTQTLPMKSRSWDLSEIVYDPKAHSQMQADTLNQLAEPANGWDCPHCRNKGYIAHPKENGFGIYTVECTCYAIRKSLRLMKESGLRNLRERYTFDRFQVQEPWQAKAKAKAMAYSQNMNGWLLMSGQSGCGKTHLCAAVCLEQMEKGTPVRYMAWRQQVGAIRDAYGDGQRRRELMDQWKKAPVLCMDDLFKIGGDSCGQVRPTQSDLNIAFEILDYRYCAGLPTIVSTEFAPEQLADFDQALGGRIIEMAGENMLYVAPDVRKNYRMQRRCRG